VQVNREKLAEVLECSLRTIDQYIKDGMPGDKPKHNGDQWKISTGAVIKWLQSRERRSGGRKRDPSKDSEDELKRRKLAAEAEKAERENAIAGGNAVSVSDFESAWSQMIGAARAKLLGLGAKVGPTVAILNDKAECKALIDAAAREALQELSEFEANLQVESASDPEPEGSDEEGLLPLVAAARSDCQ
jgi:phage terminase Nu1 subunit (DNA packaging protein)